MLVFLVGYMGSGKSFLGKKLALCMQMDFIDLDNYIEEKYEMSVTEFFSKKGEDAFRIAEKEALKEIFTRTSTIVSVGGGTPCFGDNMEQMNRYGKTIFINTPMESILRHLKSGKHQRPLLNGKTDEELHDFVHSHYTGRLPYYKKAQCSISATNIRCEDLLHFFDNC